MSDHGPLARSALPGRRSLSPGSRGHLLYIAACATGLVLLSACAPEVGSERWCAAMRDTPRGDWSANEALDFARHCVFETDNGDER